eukprot:m51a1_g5069 putative ras gtpase activation domain-containing protein (577) ;mRNA; f:144551-146621
MFMNVAKQSLAEAMGMGDATPEPPEVTAANKEANFVLDSIAAVVSTVEKPVPEKQNYAGVMLGSDHLARALTDFGAHLKQRHEDFSGDLLTLVGEVQGELFQRRKRFDEEMREKFVRPQEETLSIDQRRLSATRHQHERHRKNYDSLRARTQGLAKDKAPDGAKLLAAQEELYAASAEYESARLRALHEAQDVSHRKEFVFLGGLRALVQAQVEHFRECARMLEALEPQLRAAEEHCASYSEQFEQVQAARAKVAATRAEDRHAGRFDYLLELLDGLLEVVPPASKDQVTAAFARMLDSERRALPIIRECITQTVAETESPLLIFRQNTTPIRLMSVYTKTLAAEHVRQVLSEPVQTVVDKRPEQYEIDEALLGGSHEVAASNAQNLARACDMFVDSFVSNTSTCPLPVREICKHLRDEVAKKEGNANAGELAVGGFVLLRLYCPGITAAAASGILPQEPTGPQQRALVLVAKALQAIANGTVGTKEPFMKLLEPYISRASQRIRRWYDELTSVTEADLDRYAASVRRDETRAADLPLIEDLCRTNIRGLGKALVASDNKPLLVKLTGVLAHLGSV